MIKVESILKWKVEGPILKKLKLMRSQILSKNDDAVALSDEDLHVTLASGPGWKSVRSRVKAGDFEEPEFKIDIEPTFKVLEKGGKKSWYVKVRDQQNWKEYVMDLLQGGYDKGRVYHISIANLTGKIGDSVAMVEDRDYKDEYKKFQSSKKMKKYRAELNRYNRHKGTYGNHDKKDASHRGGRIVGFEDESSNRGRAEKSRLPKKKIEESIKPADTKALKQFLDKNLKGIIFDDRKKHIKTDHTDREIVFNGARLRKTFQKLIKKHGNKLAPTDRFVVDDCEYMDDNRHFVYDHEYKYILVFQITDMCEGRPDQIFLVTEYPNLPWDRRDMIRWDVPKPDGTYDKTKFN